MHFHSLPYYSCDGLKLKLEEMKVRTMQQLSADSDSKGKWIRLRVCFDIFSGKI